MGEVRTSADMHARFSTLVDEHGARLWRFAYRLVGRRAEADDLTQETFLQAWRSLSTLRSDQAAGAWLATILVRRAQRFWRQAARQRGEGAQEGGALRGPEPGARSDAETLDGMVRRESVQRALDTLVPERRTPFLLVLQEGFTCRQTAEMLDLPVGTVLSRIHRARLDLRQALGGSHAAAIGEGVR